MFFKLFKLVVQHACCYEACCDVGDRHAEPYSVYTPKHHTTQAATQTTIKTGSNCVAENNGREDRKWADLKGEHAHGNDTFPGIKAMVTPGSGADDKIQLWHKNMQSKNQAEKNRIFSGKSLRAAVFRRSAFPCQDICDAYVKNR